MLTALIIAFITFVLWKLTPVVFDIVKRRKQFKADETLSRHIHNELIQAEEEQAVKMAEREHTKRVEESVGHQNRVQYPWLRRTPGISDNTYKKWLADLKKTYEEEGP